MNKKLILLYLLVTIVIGYILMQIFATSQNWLTYSIAGISFIAFSLYLFWDKKYILFKIIIIALFLVYFSSLYLNVDNIPNLVQFLFNLAGYISIVSMFLYLSFHSFELYKDEGLSYTGVEKRVRLWIFELILAILIINYGSSGISVLALSGLGLYRLGPLLTYLIFLISFIILATKAWKHKRNSSYFWFVLILLLVGFIYGLFLSMFALFYIA